MATADQVLDITLLSLLVSGSATSLAAGIGVPLGAAIGLREFRGKSMVRTLVYTLFGLPPVVVGLALFIALSGSGPFGGARLLFTPQAMVLAQLVIILPIVTGVTMTVVTDVDGALKETLLSLGASRRQYLFGVLAEARPGIMTGVMLAFGRAIGEVGAVILVGGNIEGSTQVLTTAIVQETRKGNFDLALGLGAVLLVTAFALYFLFNRYQERARR